VASSCSSAISYCHYLTRLHEHLITVVGATIVLLSLGIYVGRTHIKSWIQRHRAQKDLAIIIATKLTALLGLLCFLILNVCYLWGDVLNNFFSYFDKGHLSLQFWRFLDSSLLTGTVILNSLYLLLVSRFLSWKHYLLHTGYLFIGYLLGYWFLRNI